MADDRPRWREDFPVRWDEDHYMTRRELAKFLTLGSGLLASVNVLIAFIGLTRRRPDHARCERIADVDDIPPGGSLLFRYPTDDDPCILVRDAPGTARCVLAGLHPPVVRGRAPARTSERWPARATRDRSPSRRRPAARRAADAAPAAHRDRAAR